MWHLRLTQSSHLPEEELKHLPSQSYWFEIHVEASVIFFFEKNVVCQRGFPTIFRSKIDCSTINHLLHQYMNSYIEGFVPSEGGDSGSEQDHEDTLPFICGLTHWWVYNLLDYWRWQDSGDGNTVGRRECLGHDIQAHTRSVSFPAACALLPGHGEVIEASSSAPQCPSVLVQQRRSQLAIGCHFRNWLQGFPPWCHFSEVFCHRNKSLTNIVTQAPGPCMSWVVAVRGHLVFGLPLGLHASDKTPPLAILLKGTPYGTLAEGATELQRELLYWPHWPAGPGHILQFALFEVVLWVHHGGHVWLCQEPDLNCYRNE